jgi:hypothetical protein
MRPRSRHPAHETFTEQLDRLLAEAETRDALAEKLKRLMYLTSRTTLTTREVFGSTNWDYWTFRQPEHEDFDPLGVYRRLMRMDFGMDPET